MKSFDLEEAKAGKPVVTREGLPARVICWDYQNSDYPDHPIVALVTMPEGNEKLVTYTREGKQFSDEMIENESYLDLFMAPVKKEGWINIYKSQEGTRIGSVIRDTKEDSEGCINFYDYAYLATIKVEWEE